MHAISVDFTQKGVQVHSGKSTFGLILRGYGYGDKLATLKASLPNAMANRVEYSRGSVTEWYINGPLGLEQGFTLSRPPMERHEGPVTLGLQISGDLAASVGLQKDDMTLKQGNGSAALSYRGLTAYDSTGRQLHSWLQMEGNRLLVRVDDKGARYPIVVDPFVQAAKLINPNGASNDSFGEAVAISGDTIVVGSGENEDQGAAYVFVRSASGWEGPVSRLTASGGAVGDDFGSAVAISGDTVVVGANAVNGDQGAAYVFVKPASGWGSQANPTQLTQNAVLTAATGSAGDDFGFDVSISGDTVVAGAPQLSNIGTTNKTTGAAYVFVKPADGWIDMTENTVLTASTGTNYDNFGFAVAISGDTVVIAAPGVCATTSPPDPTGVVYVFLRPGEGWGSNLTETAILSRSGSETGIMGLSVAISGDTVVTGADYTDDWDITGAVYVFVKPAAGWINMTQTARLRSSDIPFEDAFGASLSISGDWVAVGDPNFYILPGMQLGKAYLFVKPTEGWKDMIETEQLPAPNQSEVERFGYAVAISGNTVAVGAIGDNMGQGAAYVYEPEDTTPDQFTFVDQSGVQLNTLVTSNTITVSGINVPVPISITGGEYSINGGVFTDATGTVNNGDGVKVELVSSGSYSTTTGATLTIGGVSDTFSVTTDVQRYGFSGFFSPVDNLPTVNNAKAGQAIPVIWRITDTNGVPISDPASFTKLVSYPISCDAISGGATSPVEEYSTGSSGLQYSGDGVWQFNWKIPRSYAGQCRMMVLTLVDGSTHTADFMFK